MVYVGLHRQSLYAVQSYSDSNKKIAPGCGDDPCPEMPYDIIGWHEVHPGGRPGLPPGESENMNPEDHSPGSCRIVGSADKCPTHVITEGARPESDTQGKMVQDKNKYTNKHIILNDHIIKTNNPVANALYIGMELIFVIFIWNKNEISSMVKGSGSEIVKNRKKSKTDNNSKTFQA